MSIFKTEQQNSYATWDIFYKKNLHKSNNNKKKKSKYLITKLQKSDIQMLSIQVWYVL